MKHQSTQHPIPHGLSPLLLLLTLLLTTSGHAQGVLDKAQEEITEPELWQEYYGWRAAGDPDRAYEVALKLMTATATRHGEESAEFGRALAEVGVTGLLLEHQHEALYNLMRAEDILEQQLPLFSEKLIAPLTFLGSALQSAGRHEDALYAFSRAQHITHRRWGNNNEHQIRIVYAKADSFQAMGDLVQAEELHRHAYKLHRINYGVTSPQAIAAAARLGTWLRSTGDYLGSISHFHHSLTELQGNGPDRPEAFPLLRGMAHAYRGGFRGKNARGMHQRIIEMMTSHPDQFTNGARIEAHLEYGDWLMQRYFESRAVKQYEAAWHLADSAAPVDDRWLEYLETPRMIRYGGMAPFDIDGEDQYLRFRFDLTADGRPRRVEVTDHGTDSREQYAARREFPKEVRYRPAIVNGQAVAMAEQSTTMYLLPPGTLLEPAPVGAPERLTGRSNDLGLELGAVEVVEQ